MIKVRVLPLQPHCLAFGGFDIQMLSVLSAARSMGVDAQALDPWSRDGDFQVLHVWGLNISHLPAIQWAHLSGKRVVMTALLPYATIKHLARHRVVSLTSIGRLRQRLLRMVDLLVVVNEFQAETARKFYGFPEDKLEVIPHLIEAPYFEKENNAAGQGLKPKDYVLCTGNICKRKNQLNLAKATIEENLQLLLIGKVLPGEEPYAKALQEIVDGQSNIDWIHGLEPKSPLLLSAYQGAKLFSLPSLEETQPISALEAAATGLPLMLAKRPYAFQRYYKNACLVDARSVVDIQRGLREVIENPAKYVTPRDLLEECHAEKIGKAYGQVYATVAMG